MHAYAYPCMCICIWICTCIYICMHMKLHMHMHVHFICISFAYVYAFHMHMHMHANICIIQIYIYICVYIYIFVCSLFSFPVLACPCGPATSVPALLSCTCLPLSARYVYSLLHRPMLAFLCGPATFKACSIVMCLPASVGQLLLQPALLSCACLHLWARPFYSLLYTPVFACLSGPATFVACSVILCLPVSVCPLLS